MHSNDKVRAVFALRREGAIQRHVAERTGVSLGQVRKWLRMGEAAVLASPMRQAQQPHEGDECGVIKDLPPGPYAYLLGQYLGDGCIVRMPNGVFRLAITTCDDYPLIREECADAMRLVMPGRSVYTASKQGCTDVLSYSKHWPCVIPQHGSGRKHHRRIVLEPWQERLALDLHPELFVRGLIDSDGCRAINRVTSKGRGYEYVRYFLSNRSADIRQLFIDACALIGVDARQNNDHSVSVARRDSVEILECIVGPKA